MLDAKYHTDQTLQKYFDFGPSRYQGLDNLPASMTLGRRGHYGGLRGAPGAAARVYDEHGGGGGMAGGSGPASGPLMGAGVGVVGGGGGGQYATLSKQCKTLESSDFY